MDGKRWNSDIPDFEFDSKAFSGRERIRERQMKIREETAESTASCGFFGFYPETANRLFGM